MAPSRIRSLVVAAVVALPTRVAAQAWPDIALQAALGISAVDSRGSLGGMVGVTRSWGPVVGGVGAEFRIVSRGDASNQARYDPLNGRFYCGNRPANMASQNCLSSLGMEGALTGEIGFALAPFAPLVFTTGYRAGPISEPFVAATVYGFTRVDRMSWMMRVAAGRKLTLVAAGVVLELGTPFD
jgi:hypothetical protein